MGLLLSGALRIHTHSHNFMLSSILLRCFFLPTSVFVLVYIFICLMHYFRLPLLLFSMRIYNMNEIERKHEWAGKVLKARLKWWVYSNWSTWKILATYKKCIYEFLFLACIICRLLLLLLLYAMTKHREKKQHK